MGKFRKFNHKEHKERHTKNTKVLRGLCVKAWCTLWFKKVQ